MRVENYSTIYRPTCRRLVWISFSKCLTFLIPNFVLYYLGGLKTNASRTAWREKITFFLLYLFTAAFLFFWLEYISTLFCDSERTWKYNYVVFSNDSKLSAINGKAVDWQYDNTSLNPMVQFVNENPHLDLSPNFPTFMDLYRSSPNASYGSDQAMLNDCIYDQDKASQADAWLDYLVSNHPGYNFQDGVLTSCPVPQHLNKTGAPCFYGSSVDSQINSLHVKGDIEYEPNDIPKLYSSLPSPGNMSKEAYVILDGYVLDVTNYLSAVTNIIPLSTTLSSRSFALDRMFLPLDLTLFLYLNLGNDISPYFTGNVTEDPDLYRSCIIHLFQKGVLHNVSSSCSRINPALWATMGCGLVYFLIKVNLTYLSRLPFIKRLLFSSDPEPSSHVLLAARHSVNGGGGNGNNHEKIWPHTILFVPCFSESFETLKQTIDTLSRSAYDDTKKLLLFVCDGVTTSQEDGEKETHVLLLEHLGYSCTEEPVPQPYNSLGQNTKRVNYALVYSGFYETGRNRVPYLVIVKIGRPRELVSSHNVAHDAAPAGSRGKRDSLVLIFSFLERCLNLANNQISPLDYEIFNQCYNVLGIDPRLFKYLMVTDADIQVQSDAVQKLVLRLESDRKMLAVSGHIRPANPEENLVTMLQIFPVYMAYFSSLAYEACLKSVTTMNGGLAMYKLWTENNAVAIEKQEEQSRKFLEKWKLLQRNNKNSNNSSQQGFATNGRPASLQQMYLNNTYPKLSDEIIVINPFEDHNAASRRSSSSSSNNSDTTTATATTTEQVQRHYSASNGDRNHHRLTSSTRPESRLSLAARVDIRACCIHPTVLRSLATLQIHTMHMQNLLLLGEEKVLPTILLKSHPEHRLGFEPEAIGYATLPTNFFTLQGLQTRSIRAAFHNQLELQRVSWQLGFSYWILATTELLDMIFSMPITMYLYSIFIRSIQQYTLAYFIIACSFTGLLVLHILFFLLRRQFRYIFWFLLYCLLSMPLFVVWFPLLAVWQSNHAEYWYDVWPIANASGVARRFSGFFGASRSRLHGIIDRSSSDEAKLFYKKATLQEKQVQQQRKRKTSDAYSLQREDSSGYYHDEDFDSQDATTTFIVPRMSLAEYEIAEAKRLHQAAEAALDSNFIGFAAATGFNNNSNGVVINNEENNDDMMIATPPMVQVREGVHSTRIITQYNRRSSSSEIYYKATPTSWKKQHQYNNSTYNNKIDSPDSYANTSKINPFADENINPFDDDYGINNHSNLPTRGDSEDSNSYYLGGNTNNTSRLRHLQHRPSHSQSSYLTYASRNSQQYDGSQGASSSKGVYISTTTEESTTLSSSLTSSGFAKIPNHYYHSEKDNHHNHPADTLLHTNPDLVDTDRASIISVESKTISIFTSEDALSPHEKEDDWEDMERQPPHHRFDLINTTSEAELPPSPLEDHTPYHNHNRLAAVDGSSNGRTKAQHNFSPFFQPPLLSNSSNANLRQQSENHSNINVSNFSSVTAPLQQPYPPPPPIPSINTNTIGFLKSRRSKKLTAVTPTGSGSSVYRHYRNTSEYSTATVTPSKHHHHHSGSSVSTVFSRPASSKVNLITNTMTVSEVQHQIRNEIRFYLQRANLEATTRAQVKAHLVDYFGAQRIDERDENMMTFMNSCIEEVTFEFLNS